LSVGFLADVVFFAVVFFVAVALAFVRGFGFFGFVGILLLAPLGIPVAKSIRLQNAENHGAEE